MNCGLDYHKASHVLKRWCRETKSRGVVIRQNDWYRWRTGRCLGGVVKFRQERGDRACTEESHGQVVGGKIESMS